MTTVNKTERCCCGKVTIFADESAIIHNDYQHERIGPNQFCGTRINHNLRDLNKEVARLEAQVAHLEDEDERWVEMKKNWQERLAITEHQYRTLFYAVEGLFQALGIPQGFVPAPMHMQTPPPADPVAERIYEAWLKLSECYKDPLKDFPAL